MSLGIEVKKQVDRFFGTALVSLTRSFSRTRSTRPLPSNVHRILLIKLWGVGNLAMILPLCRALKERYPDARIDFLTLESNRSFLEACPWIDRVHLFRQCGILRPFVELFRLARGLRDSHYDLVLDFEQFLKTSALLTKIASPQFSVGFRTPHQGRHGLYDIEVAHDSERHMALVFTDIVRAIGVDTESLPPLFVPRSDRGKVQVMDWLLEWGVPENGRPLVALHTGSGDNFPGRRWPASAFASLADHLVRERNAIIVFTGTESERSTIEQCRLRMTADSIDMSGRMDLPALVEFLAMCNLVVSNDTAPVHIASALGTPLIAIYGPNTPKLYGPLSSQARVFYLDLACSPCLTNTNAKTSFCRHQLCIRSIDPAAVTAAALVLLGPNKRAPSRGIPSYQVHAHEGKA